MSRAIIVESIPTDLSLREFNQQHNIKNHAYSEDMFVNLLRKAKQNIDLTAMYWSLIPNNPPEGACVKTGTLECCAVKNGCAATGTDCRGKCEFKQFFSDDEMKKFNADWGVQIYQALEDALKRGIKVRVLESPGFGGSDEALALQKKYPDLLQIQIVNMKAPPGGTAANSWYGGGIMHQKIWIIDGESKAPSFYLGSANMDWKSIAQVKELGIVIEANENDPMGISLCDDLSNYYEGWWNFSSPKLSGYSAKNGIVTPYENTVSGKPGIPPTKIFYDESIAAKRQVPEWSKFIPGNTKPNLATQGLSPVVPNWNKPLPLTLNGETGLGYISGAPDEVIVSGRTKDRDSIVNTIRNADKFVCISVMDFTPTSIYLVSADGKPLDVWWPDFFDAILYAVFQKRADVKVLVSKWATSPHTEGPFLQKLDEMAAVCKIAETDPNWSGAANFPGKTPCGTLEVRRFIMPGWDETYQGKAAVDYSVMQPKFPSFSRVNHTKYIVTDKRANIGTSNWTWGYFFNTAGSSLNLTHPGIITTLKQIFNRDWEAYGKPNLPSNTRSPIFIVISVIVFFISLLLLFFVK